jgi:hypothetical protein
MGLTMSQRQAVTKTIATRYKRASRAEKGAILDELCATTGIVTMPVRRWAGAGSQGRPAAPASGSQVWGRRGGRVAVLLGGARCADG